MLKSGEKVAAYLFKPKGKLYDFNEMVKYTELKALEVEVEIDEFYADGWDDIPNGIEELLSDVDNYNAILLYSLDGLDETQIKYLGKNMIYCINAPWIKGSNKNNNCYRGRWKICWRIKNKLFIFFNFSPS